MICSAGSYSAGSNMPCIVKEYGVPILGETSSGGGCYWGEFKMTMGNLYNLASYATLKTRGGKSIEAGAEPDYPLDYSEIHDFQKIDEILDKFEKMDEAAQIAVSTATEFVQQHPGELDEIKWVLYDMAAFKAYTNEIEQWEIS